MQEKLEKKLCLNLHLKQNSHLHSFLGVTLQIETKLFSGYMISRCLVKLAAMNGFGTHVFIGDTPKM